LDISGFPVAKPPSKIKDGFHRRGAEYAEGEKKNNLFELCVSAVNDFFLRALRVLRGEYSFAAKPEQPFT